MSRPPSIKGTLLVDLVGDVRRLCEQGTISQQEIETKLEPADRNLLEREPLVLNWYDVGIFRRLVVLLREHEGGGNDYIRECGFRTAQRLLEANIYQQMDYLDRAEIFGAQTETEVIEAGRRDLRLLVSLSGSLLSFSHWQVIPDSEHKLRHRMEISDAGAFCDELAWYTEGLIDAMAARQGLKGLWRWARVSEDFIVFRMTRDPTSELQPPTSGV